MEYCQAINTRGMIRKKMISHRKDKIGIIDRRSLIEVAEMIWREKMVVSASTFRMIKKIGFVILLWTPLKERRIRISTINKIGAIELKSTSGLLIPCSKK